VPQNDAEAVKWYRLAADQGDARAQFNLGFSYDNGRGVPQNHAEALKWFRLAADQGNANAQNDLAVMYAKGEGVPPDFVRAHMWFNLSAMRGEQRAAKNKDNIAKRMTPAQIAEAQKLVREWQPKRP
jgi:TPR repeat protein